MALGCNSGFLEMSHEGSRGVLLLCLLKTELKSGIAVLLNALDLSYNARTYFDNSAWHIFALGTEHGCHSDFLS